MKRDAMPPSRPGPREAWEDRRPPPAAATDEVPDPTRLRDRPVRPVHLVLTNGAAGRADVLLGVAGRLAGRAGAAVRVAHLYTPPPPGDPGAVRLLSPASRGGPAADVHDRLARAARSLADRTGLPVSPELLTGPALAQYLRANEFDLVTVAAGGGWLPLWAGGLWHDFARWRPVLVVGPGVPASWSAATRDVLVPLDGTAGAEAAVAPAVSLCRLLDARLTLLAADRPGRAGDSADCRHQYLLDVGRLVRRHVLAVRTVVASGRPAGAVLTVQRATGAVVSLTAPARSWLGASPPGRLETRVLRAATAPVLFHRPTL